MGGESLRTYAIIGQERSCEGEVGAIVHGKKTTVYQDGKRVDGSIRHSTALTGITLPLVSDLSVPKAWRPVVERYPSLIPILFNLGGPWSASCQQRGSCRVRGKKLSGQENQRGYFVGFCDARNRFFMYFRIKLSPYWFSSSYFCSFDILAHQILILRDGRIVLLYSLPCRYKTDNSAHYPALPYAAYGTADTSYPITLLETRP